MKTSLRRLVLVGSVFLAVPLLNARADVLSGMIGHWTFDEGTGQTAYDTSGTGNDATLMGNASWTRAGKFGGAISLSGTTLDYLQVATPVSVPIGNNPRTIALWAKWSDMELAGPAYQALFSYGAGWANGVWCSLERGGDIFYKRLFFDTWGGSSSYQNDCAGSTPEALPAGQWTHVAMTYDGSTTRLYLNGQPDVATINIAVNTVLGSSGLMMGNSTWRDDGWHLNFGGLLDDVYLYNRALSPAEIQQLMTMPPQISVTSISVQTNGHVVLQCRGVPNRSHTVYMTADLNQAFTPLATIVAGADGTFEYEEVNAVDAARRFYRVSYH